MSQKVFRHTPHRAADAMKIIVGNKTNATIRDVEETLEDILEKEGTVTSIDKDKINGEGWHVTDSDGEKYLCTCASDMYQLPETEEHGGVYYPKDQVSVKFTVNPMLKTNTITEITSLGKDEKKLDLSKWKHGDEATTIIAKPMSAISISNAIISFNYNNANEVTADEKEIKTEGKKTNINTFTLDINSEDINIQDQPLDEYIRRQAQNTDLNQQKDDGMNVLQQDNLGQLNLNIQTTYIPGQKQKAQRVIKDLKDPSLYPEETQRQPLLTGSNIDELYIYPNGLVTIQRRAEWEKQDESIFSTHQWITTNNTYKNLLKVSVVRICDCCAENIDGIQTYFNYCPRCRTWNTLYNKGNVIACTGGCNLTWCQGCGHPYNVNCTDKSLDLKKYDSWHISAIGMSCDYCKNEIPHGKTRIYADYCPKCHKWGYLTLETEYNSDGEEQRFLHCDSCNESYCVNCAISQGKSFIKSFLNDNIAYDYFTENFAKIRHIRDD